MSQKSRTAIAVVGIDIGKNSFHVVGHDAEGAHAGLLPVSSYRLARPGGRDLSGLNDLRCRHLGEGSGIEAARYAYPGVPHSGFLHECIENGGNAGGEPDTAMRDWFAQALSVRAAMDGVAGGREEDRMRHRRIVPLVRVMVGLHAEGGIGAARRPIAARPRLDEPDILLNAVDRDGHFLIHLVDRNLDAFCRCSPRPGYERGQSYRREPLQTQHCGLHSPQTSLPPLAKMSQDGQE